MFSFGSKPKMCSSIVDAAIAECLKSNNNDKGACKWVYIAKDLCEGKVTEDSIENEVAEQLKKEPKAPNKKICCTCPPSKLARDNCTVANSGEDCRALVFAHRMCLKSEGFVNVCFKGFETATIDLLTFLLC